MNAENIRELSHLHFAIIMASLAMIGVATVIYVTSWGMGTDVDSASYLMAARNLAAGQGLTLQLPDTNRFVPLSAFPPLFPVTLAAWAYLSRNVFAAARWLNAVLFGLNIVLIGYIVKRCTAWTLGGIFSALLALTTVDVVNVHSYLISEPLFLFIALGGLILITRYIEKPTIPRLLLFSLIVSLAVMTRYVGVCFLPVGLAAIWLGNAPRRRRLTHSLIFAAIFGIPATLWIVRNLIFLHTMAGRKLAFHPPDLSRYIFSLVSFSSWFLPAAIPAVLRIAVLIGIVALTFGAKSSSSAQAMRRRTFQQISAIFIISYLTVFVIAQTFFDAQIWIAGRHLLLIFVTGSMIVICQLYQPLRAMKRQMRQAITWTAFGILALCGARLTRFAVASHRSGLGLTSKHWQTSELIADVRKLNGDVPIISNSTAVIYLCTGRIAFPLPNPVNAQTQRVRPQYAAEMTRLFEETQNNGAVLILFKRFLADEGTFVDGLADRLELQKVVITPDGYLLAKRPAK
jgi:hypothetical protein